ncbi:MAG: 16S rRNA processing protein RimM [Bacteroidia bacterium]|nr:16S rRNA processing protein RimM [Bacteroidia bacterium]
MNIDQCFYFGKLIRLRGMDGTLVMEADVDHPKHYQHLKSIYVDLDNRLLIQDIDKIQIQSPGFIKFTQTDVEAAAILVGCDLYLPLNQLPTLSGNDFYYHEIIGFTIIDKAFGTVGEIENIYDMPQHGVARVMCQDKEVLVPLLKMFVTSINRNKKQMLMQLPDGLLDVYLLA